jgi:hypothetical protein
VATYLAKRGRRTSNAVARTLFEIAPDDYGLGEEAPPDEAELAALTQFAERMRAKPANDNTLQPVAVAAAAYAALAAPAPDAAGTSFASPHLGAALERFVAGLTRTPALPPRKCEPWAAGHYTRSGPHYVLLVYGDSR